MKTSWRSELPQWALIAGMFVLAAVAWPWAPERVPIHFNMAGQADNFGSKAEGLLMLPLIGLGVYLLLLLAPRIDPGRKSYALFSGSYNAIRLAILAVLAIVYGTMHLALRGLAIDVAAIAPLVLGGLLIVLGNAMGKIRPNWFVGIRTPWTLSSKESWVKTHRLGGWLLVLQGLGLMLAGVLHVTWVMPAMIALLVASIIVTYAYSYRVWREDPDKIPPAGTLPAA